jgi:hypothetical protein
VGNTVMSTPISATIVSAARLPTPVMVTSRSRAPSERGDHLLDATIQRRDGLLQLLQVPRRTSRA